MTSQLSLLTDKPKPENFKYSWFSYHEPYFINENFRDTEYKYLSGCNCSLNFNSSLFDTAEEALNDFIKFYLSDSLNISDDRAILHVVCLNLMQQNTWKYDLRRLQIELQNLDDDPNYESYKLQNDFASNYAQFETTISDFYPRIESCIDNNLLFHMDEINNIVTSKLLEQIQNHRFHNFSDPKFAYFTFCQPDTFYDWQYNLNLNKFKPNGTYSTGLFNSGKDALSKILQDYERDEDKTDIWIVCLTPEEQKCWGNLLYQLRQDLNNPEFDFLEKILNIMESFIGNLSLPAFHTTPSDIYPFTKTRYNDSGNQLLNALIQHITEELLHDAKEWEEDLKHSDEFRSYFPTSN